MGATLFRIHTIQYTYIYIYICIQGTTLASLAKEVDSSSLLCRAGSEEQEGGKD